MLPHQQIERQVISAATLDEAAASLALLFSSGLSVWQSDTLYYTKQVVARVHGLKIEMYAREHPPPHFHVTGGGINATFSLEDCSLINGEISGREQALVRWWYRRSGSILISAWNQSRPSDCPVGPVQE
jgi:hypothetical protein